ncbi:MULTISPECIES: PTS transporter subunit EIIC [Micrococcaceae]|uniref:PTS transporter subunit EIIC n=1 Tax=unclassified Kocuria TaxID=2649579 RepID=UPI0010107919|nr:MULTISPECIES: PTS transporter subunit EIIC [unclassified Kocuria]
MSSSDVPMTAAGSSPKKGDGKSMKVLQRFGRSLMLPIAALPAAAILQRLGQDDLLGRFSSISTAAQVIGAAGTALFDGLPLLFAVGISFGFAKKGDGSTALAAVVGYLVMTNVFKVMSPVVLSSDATSAAGEDPAIDYGVLGGIVIGLTSAMLWQRFHRTKLPDWLGFFGGRRLVPILTSLAALVLGVVLALIYPLFDKGLSAIGTAVGGNPVAGAGLYGVLNRLLIPFGLHHILNSIVWFILGDYNGAHGDLTRFFAGDPSAGVFMTGFFPIMMFGLPAAALAIWHEAKPGQKKIVGGIMLSTGLTSFLTGITEPLEFSFMFIAWPLYLIHAVLMGTSMALTNALGIHSGFGFSAGTIDYVLNFGISQNSIWLIPIGVGYGLIYYFLFRFVIRKWNLRTPGREEDPDEGAAVADGDLEEASSSATERVDSADGENPRRETEG